MVCIRRGGLLGLGLAACSSPNPAFDPVRMLDTDTIGTTDGASTAMSVPLDDDDDGAGSDAAEDTGSGSSVICPDQPLPAQKVEFSVLLDGTRVHRCGQASSTSGCTLRRNTKLGLWEVSGCGLHDAWVDGDVYTLDFQPAGPDVNLMERSVEIAFEFGEMDGGCKLRWVEIVAADGDPTFPRLLYQAATTIEANPMVEVTADVGQHLDLLCVCGSFDAACCAAGVGLHELILSHSVIFAAVVLSQIDPTYYVAIPNTEIGYEAIVVRAWEPPACDAPPENEWVVRQTLGPG